MTHFRFMDDSTKELVDMVIREQLKLQKNEKHFDSERQERAQKKEEIKQLQQEQEQEDLQEQLEAGRAWQKRCEEAELQLEGQKNRINDVTTRTTTISLFHFFIFSAMRGTILFVDTSHVKK